MTAVIWDAAPDTVLLRRWRILATSENHLRATLATREPNRYGEGGTLQALGSVEETARIVESVLRKRGYQPCPYCVTVAPERHHSPHCPDFLLERLGLTDG